MEDKANKIKNEKKKEPNKKYMEDQMIERNLVKYIRSGEITEGREIKNYKELCKLLEIKEKTGEGKQNQLRKIEQYIKLRKEGFQYIVEDIYKKPIFDYGKGEKSFQKLNEAVLLQLLQGEKNRVGTGVLITTKKYLAKVMGYINYQFIRYWDKRGELARKIHSDIEKELRENRKRLEIELQIELEDERVGRVEEDIAKMEDKITTDMIKAELSRNNNYIECNNLTNTKEVVEDFFDQTSRSFSRIINKTINTLEDKLIVESKPIVIAIELKGEETIVTKTKINEYGDEVEDISSTVQYKAGKKRRATIQERKMLLKIKNEECNKLGCEFLSDVMKKGKINEFYYNVKKRVREEIKLYGMFVGLEILYIWEGIEKEYNGLIKDLSVINKTFMEKGKSNYIERNSSNSIRRKGSYTGSYIEGEVEGEDAWVEGGKIKKKRSIGRIKNIKITGVKNQKSKRMKPLQELEIDEKIYKALMEETVLIKDMNNVIYKSLIDMENFKIEEGMGDLEEFKG